MDYERIRALAKNLGEIVEEKNRAYGDSSNKTGMIMAILYPEGIRCEQMTDALLMVRILDKLSRIATDPSYNGESPWQDLAGYGLIGQEMHHNCATTEPQDQEPDDIGEPINDEDPNMESLDFIANAGHRWNGECCVPGCAKRGKGSRGMCKSHYDEWLKWQRSKSGQATIHTIDLSE